MYRTYIAYDGTLKGQGLTKNQRMLSAMTTLLFFLKICFKSGKVDDNRKYFFVFLSHFVTLSQSRQDKRVPNIFVNATQNLRSTQRHRTVATCLLQTI